MYLTLTGLVSPASDVKLRNMSGPVGIVNHLSVFAKIGFKSSCGLWFLLMSIWPSSICYHPSIGRWPHVLPPLKKYAATITPCIFGKGSNALRGPPFSFMLYVTFFDAADFTSSLI